MGFLGLTEMDIESLKYEIMTSNARLQLTRLIRIETFSEEDNLQLQKQNRLINIANNVLGKPIYILEPDDMGDYMSFENSWHYGEIEVLMRRPSTIQLVEILADLLQEDLLDIDVVNNILREDSTSIFFEKENYNNFVKVYIIPFEEIEEVQDSEEHPNITKLVKRMDTSIVNDDYSATLHASASIFETLAKDIVSLPSVENKSLGSFFDRYRTDSKLPETILDYIISIFNKRNTEPLAGHGSTRALNVSKEEAIILSEMTKTFVRMERKLALIQVN